MKYFDGLVNDVVGPDGKPLPPGPSIVDAVKRSKRKMKVEKRRGDPHKYHTPKMLRCLTYLEAQGKDPGAAHRICYASIGESANKEPDESIRTRADLKNKITDAFAEVPADKIKSKMKRLKGSSSGAARAARRGLRIAETAKSISQGLMTKVQKSLVRPHGDVWGHLAKHGVDTGTVNAIWWDWDGERYLVSTTRTDAATLVKSALGSRTIIRHNWTPREADFGRLTVIENWLPDDVREEISL